MVDRSTGQTFDMKHELIEACKRDERPAQHRLYSQYADAMYNVCYRMTKNHEDAQDILQLAFIKVFKNIGQFKYDSTPGAWIKRIVINQCMDHFRKKKIHFVDIEGYDIAEEDLPTSETAQWTVSKVKNVIESLSDGYRTVATLYLFEGYDHQEISQILGITVNTSKTQYHRAKKKILQVLKE